MKYLDSIRKPRPAPKALLHSLLLLLAGLLTGIAIKLLDIFFLDPVGIFSQSSVWVLLCTLIALRSASPLRAGLNVFLFCVVMLVTYYITAELTSRVYGVQYIYGWGLFAPFTPPMGFVVWYIRGRHPPLSLALRLCVLAAMLLLALILFRKLRISDLPCAAATALLLWKKDK